MPQNPWNERWKTRRTPNACVQCRHSKIKCSGNKPCSNCIRRGTPCRFEECSKVRVSERYLQELENLVARQSRSPLTASRSQDDDPSVSSHDSRSRMADGYRSPQTDKGSHHRNESPSLFHHGSSEACHNFSPAASSRSPIASSSTEAASAFTSRPLSNPTPRLVGDGPGHLHNRQYPSVLNPQPSEHADLGSHQSNAPLFASNLGMDDGLNSQHAGPLSDQTLTGAHSIWTSPFSLPSKTIKNFQGDRASSWIWLAPRSMWAFTLRLILGLGEKLHAPAPPIRLSNSDADVYPLEWEVTRRDQVPDVRGLPSIDRAIYLYNTMKFHLEQHFRFFDDEGFLDQMRDFYSGDMSHNAAACRLWYMKFLLVLSFGVAFLGGTRKSNEAPGARYFVRAMSLLPDHSKLWKESLLAVEILGLISLYLYAVGQRESAHVYLGQAIRIAQLEGLHTHLPEAELGAKAVARCRNLWWTLYTLDRNYSSSLGLPMCVQDTDVATAMEPPSLDSQLDMVLNLQVKLSRVLGFIFATVYEAERTQLGVFLETISSVLHTLANLAQEIESAISLMFPSSVDTIPKGTQHVTLQYHQLVIVATRPLLLSVLQERLENLDQKDDGNWEYFLFLTTPLLSTGIKSATKIVQIIADENSFLDVFLPQELEASYVAALYLIMANALFPGVLDGQVSVGDAYALLDEMIARGNRLAEIRKAELVHLEFLCQELAARLQSHGLQALALRDMDVQHQASDHGEINPSQLTLAEVTGIPPLTMTPPVIPNNMELLDSMGISSEAFFSIAEQLGTQDITGENESMIN